MASARRPRIDFTEKEYIGAPTGGWSPDVPTWMLPAEQAPLVENFMIRPGKLRVRPPFRVTADLSSKFSLSSPASLVPASNSTILLGRRVYTPSYLIEPQNIHRVGTSLPGSPTNPDDTNVYTITGSTVTAHALTVPAVMPGSRVTNFNGTIYGLSYGGAAGTRTILYNNGITAWNSVIQVLSPGATPVTVGGVAPSGCYDIYSRLSRLWTLGGRLSGTGSVAGTATLSFTNPISTLNFTTAADWEDPVSGLVNKIELDGNYADAGVALASVPAGLLIFRLNSLFILRDTSPDPASWVARPVSLNTGCIDARSVVEVDSRVYWMSSQGLMVTDGVSVQNVSGALQDELLRQISTWHDAVFTSTGAWCTCTLMTDATQILVSFGTYDLGSASGYTALGMFSALFDFQTQTWVKVSTLINPTGGANLGISATGFGSTWSLGNTSILRLESRANGQTLLGGPALWDVSTVGGTLVPITATWSARSPQAALGGREMIQLKRVYADYACSTGSGSANATLQTQLLDREDGTSTPLLTQQTAMDPTSQYRQSQNTDVQSEVADLDIEITLKGALGATGASLPSVPDAEIHGVGIEFQPTRDMRQVN